MGLQPMAEAPMLWLVRLGLVAEPRALVVGEMAGSAEDG